MAAPLFPEGDLASNVTEDSMTENNHRKIQDKDKEKEEENVNKAVKSLESQSKSLLGKNHTFIMIIISISSRCNRDNIDKYLLQG